MRDKKLYKSDTNRVICGVCGGIGEYLNLDSTVIRLIMLVMVFLGVGSGVLIYLAAALIMPEPPRY